MNLNRTIMLITATTLLALSLAVSAEPPASRVAAYIHLEQCIDAKLPIEQRQHQIQQAIESMQKSGIDSIVPYVSTTSGAAHYPSKFLTEHRWKDWDPVAAIVEAARNVGMQVHLCVPVLACGHNQPTGILREHPEWALRNLQKQPIGSISPGHPEARKWIVDWMSEIVQRYQPDGMLLDYMRYSSAETLLDPDSAVRLQALLNTESNLDDAALTQQFRETLLTGLMDQISKRLRSEQPNIQLAIYSWGFHVASDHRVGQDWPTWASKGYIDEVNISGYWFPDTFSKRFGNTHLEAFRNAIKGADRLLDRKKTRLTFALGIKTSHGEVQSIEDIENYLQIAKELGVDGTIIFTWSYLEKFLPQVQQAELLTGFRTEELSSTIVQHANLSAATVLVATADSSRRAKQSANFVGDGHGDHEQINAAIASLPPVGGTVQLAEGTYDIRKVDRTLGGVLIRRSNVVLAGYGSATKLIQAAQQNTNVIRIIGSGLHDVTIRDLSVDANRRENDQGKGDPNVSHDRFEFCGIKGYCGVPGDPAVEDLRNITIRNCQIRNSHRLGIMLEGVNLQVIDNVLGNAGSDAVELLTGPGMIRGNYVEITGPTHVAIGSDRGNSIQMSDNIIHVKEGGKLDIGFRTWSNSQRHVITGNIVTIDPGGHCGLAMDLRGQMHTVTGNSVESIDPKSTTQIRIGGGNTILSANLFRNVVVEIDDTYDDQKPIQIADNILDDSTIKHISGNLVQP